MPLHVSAPLVAFRESVFHPAEVTEVAVKRPQVGLYQCICLCTCDSRALAGLHQSSTCGLPGSFQHVCCHALYPPVHSLLPEKAPPAWCVHDHRPQRHPRNEVGMLARLQRLGAPARSWPRHLQDAEHATRAYLVCAAQVVEGITANGRCVVRVKARPLPAALAALLDDNHDLLRQAVQAGPASFPEHEVGLRDQCAPVPGLQGLQLVVMPVVVEQDGQAEVPWSGRNQSCTCSVCRSCELGLGSSILTMPDSTHCHWSWICRACSWRPQLPGVLELRVLVTAAQMPNICRSTLADLLWCTL